MRGNVPTPFGSLAIDTSERGIVACGTWLGHPAGDDSRSARQHLGAAREALAAYLAGTRRDFADLVLIPHGTAFARSVYAELCRIPLGETTTYAALAARIGRPRAARAVGRANACNRIGIFQPCHRVVGSDGSLTGFAGGLAMKQWLLDHERSIAGRAA